MAVQRWLTAPMAVGLMLVWFFVQLGSYFGEPPSLDAMVAMRESLVVKRDGFGALIDGAAAGIHPPGLDLFSWAGFYVFGEQVRSLRLLALGLFVVLTLSVERLLAPWLSGWLRVLAALAVAICPSIAIAVFLTSREGLMIAVLLPAVVLAVAPDAGPRRGVYLGLLLALLPLIKETGLLVAGPFGLYWAWVGPPRWTDRARRFALVFGPVILAAAAWRGIIELAGTSPWESYLLTENAKDGSYVVGIRAMLGMEGTLFLKQNLANGLILNWLWLPAALALVTLALACRRSTPPGLRRAIVLLAGVALVYAWTTLAFPTFTIPRYAVPLTTFVVLLAVLGLPLLKPVLRPVVLGALLIAFALGAWTPTDPVSKAVFDTTTIGGEEIYDTAEVQRGPDRAVYNLAILRADRRLNDRLERLYATDATLVTGDCFALKVGEKLYSIGLVPDAYDLEGARPLRCLNVVDLPPAALSGTDRVALLRTPEEQAQQVPVPISGPSVFVVK